MKRKYAFFLMGYDYDVEKDCATFETALGDTYLYTVHNLAEAIRLAQSCQRDGVGAIELCGAFGKEGAEKIIEATGGSMAVGYVVHDASQDALFEAFFSE